jgi:hypothetical protein
MKPWSEPTIATISQLLNSEMSPIWGNPTQFHRAQWSSARITTFGQVITRRCPTTQSFAKASTARPRLLAGSATSIVSLDGNRLPGVVPDVRSADQGRSGAEQDGAIEPGLAAEAIAGC